MSENINITAEYAKAKAWLALYGAENHLSEADIPLAPEDFVPRTETEVLVLVPILETPQATFKTLLGLIDSELRARYVDTKCIVNVTFASNQDHVTSTPVKNWYNRSKGFYWMAIDTCANWNLSAVEAQKSYNFNLSAASRFAKRPAGLEMLSYVAGHLGILEDNLFGEGPAFRLAAFCPTLTLSLNGEKIDAYDEKLDSECVLSRKVRLDHERFQSVHCDATVPIVRDLP
jgi:hypothetical protein